MAKAARQQLLDSLKEALESAEYSDLVITCGSDSHNVHKMVVCPRAKFFARTLKFPGKESQESKIDLPEDEPAIMKLLIQYLYEGEYDPKFSPSQDATARATPTLSRVNYGGKKLKRVVVNTDVMGPHTCDNPVTYCSYPHVCTHHCCGQECEFNCINFLCQLCVPVPGTADQLVVHAKLYEVADKYEVVGLKELTKENFSAACNHFWNDPAFPIAANHAFSTTPETDKGLRDIVSETISLHMELLKKPEIEAIMTEYNGLAFGLLMQIATQQRLITK